VGVAGDGGGDLTMYNARLLGIGTMNALYNDYKLIKMKKRQFPFKCQNSI
jgi:hypothetical protein